MHNNKQISASLLVISVVLVLIIFQAEAKKKSDNFKWIQQIDNAKSLKKLLRTKTNVLVMFADEESSVHKLANIYGEAAAKSKGVATLAWVDCSAKEGKKVCKKQKANPDPTEIQHFKDGEFSSKYDRRFSVKSILAFLKDPKSDGPWEEEDIAKDVVHLESAKHLNKIINKNKPTLVMFYAPWCGYCKRFKPVFAEVATELKGQVIMAGVDAEGNKDAQLLRETYNVTGFPKSIFFKNGKQQFEYSSGHTKEDLIKWLNDPQEPKPQEPEQEWSDMENDVIHLTDETFDSFIEENQKVMVFFYAPWCGHCKKMKPDWETAATMLKDEEASEKLAAMDATKYKEFGDRYKVTGYPTIIYFEDGQNKYDAGSAFKRTPEGIVEYIKDPKEPPPPEKAWNEIESDVLHLDDAGFKQAVKKKKHVLVMFYAPWCGHCKKAKPEYQNAASKFTDDKKVAFAAVDCTGNSEVCSTYDVKGYPTFYYLSYGKNPTNYQGGREEEDFVDFVLDQETNEALSTNSDEFWKDIPHSGLLYKLTNTTWSNFVHTYSKVLVTIYAEGCPNCKDLRKHLAECAKNTFEQKIDVKLAVIDSDKYSADIYRLWTQDMGVPTMFWFEKGIRKFEYTKSRAALDILNFIKNPVKPEVKKKYPDWSMQESADDIYHYNDEGFEDFAREQEEMMVFFYSPSCSDCFKLRSIYEEAASRLDEEKPSVTMTAVNLAEALRVKEKYSVNSYPHFAYFRKGQYKYQYRGKQDSDSIVEFMKNPKFISKPKVDNNWSDTETNVTVLDKSSFVQFMMSHDHVMVIFFTKWCGHCKRFKPKFEEAADTLKAENSSAQLAAVDGNEAQEFAKRYKVYGFPTMLYFKKGKFSSTYKGKREASEVVKFMLGNVDENERIEEEIKSADKDELMLSKPAQVNVVSPSNMSKFLDDNDESLIMFYAPYCGACKSAKNGFYQAAVVTTEELHDTGFGIFNALQYKDDVNDYDITGYPTFWYFRGNRKKFKYKGDYTKSSFLNFLDNPKPEKVDKESTDKNVQWISEVSHVEHPNKENFNDLINKYAHVMVFFYVSACEVCLKGIKPEYVKAADLLHQELPSSVRLVAINGAWEKSILKKYQVSSFPSFLYFHEGEMEYRYHGSWKSESLVAFMKKPQKDLAKKIKPTSWQDMTSLQFGRVTHLGNKTYDNFVANYSQAIVMFHSLYYDRCKLARERFRSAADKLSDRNEVGFGAVDCHREPDQGLVCYHLTIRKFPLYKYYEEGRFVSDLDVEHPDDVLMFLKGRLLLKDMDAAESSKKDEL